MKIALVWPKSTFLSDPRNWPPLGLWYLGAQLEAQGHHCDFYDLSFDELPRDGEYDQLWLSATSPQMREIKHIAEVTRDWETRRVLGGAAAWANPDSVRGLGYDLVVGGESDHPDSIRQTLELAKDPSTDYVLYPIARDLNWVRPPLRRWATRYYSFMQDRFTYNHRMATLFTSRGCPMECAFCESGRHGIIWDRLTRYEPLELVEEQIRELTQIGFTGLAYYDDILPLNKKRTLELMEIHEKYHVVWRCFLRTDIICKMGGFDYLRALRDGGLIECFVGVESADNRIKAAIHKGTTIEQDTAVLEWCRELGIRMKCSFILGLPGESRESMETTRAWILRHRPARVSCRTCR